MHTCTGRTTHRGSRCIALLFLDHGTRRGEGSASRPGRFYPQERTGTHCTGGWVGPRAGLDRCGVSRPHRDSISGPSSPVASRYTHYATRPTKNVRCVQIYTSLFFMILSLFLTDVLKMRQKHRLPDGDVITRGSPVN